MINNLLRWFDSDASMFTALCVIGILLSISCASPPAYVPPVPPPAPRLLAAPSSPEATRFVRIESIPDGADIYVLNPWDGTLGAKIGTTPVTHNVGFAWAKRSDGTYAYCAVWGDGVTSPDHGPVTAFQLNIAAIKDGFAIEHVSKRLGAAVYGSYPGNTTITIPLRSLRRDEPTQSSPQQQQQQQQQTVVVPGRDQPEAATTGRVILTTNVEGADISVDGLFVGNAPANLTLTSGVHIIEVKRSGYRPFKRELRVLANSETTLRAELEREE